MMSAYNKIASPLAEASQVVLVVKNPSTNAGDVRDTGSIPGLGRSPGGGNSNPLRVRENGALYYDHFTPSFLFLLSGRPRHPSFPTF